MEHTQTQTANTQTAQLTKEQKAELKRRFYQWAIDNGLQRHEYISHTALFKQWANVAIAEKQRAAAQSLFRDYCDTVGLTAEYKTAQYDNVNGYKSGTSVMRSIDVGALRDEVKDSATARAYNELGTDVARLDATLRHERALLRSMRDDLIVERAAVARLEALTRGSVKAYLTRASKLLYKLPTYCSDVATKQTHYATHFVCHVTLQARDTTKLAMLRAKALECGYSCTEINALYDVQAKHIVGDTAAYSDAFSDEPRAITVSYQFTIKNLTRHDFTQKIERDKIITIFHKLQDNLRVEAMPRTAAVLGPKSCVPRDYINAKHTRGAVPTSQTAMASNPLRSDAIERAARDIETAFNIQVDTRTAFTGMLSEAREIIAARSLNEETAYRNARYELQKALNVQHEVASDAALRGDALTAESIAAINDLIARKQNTLRKAENAAIAANCNVSPATARKRKQRAKERELKQLAI